MEMSNGICFEKRTYRPYFDLVASGQKMREIRKNRHISVEEVRRYMGFESVQAIYKWERGECLPQADTLIALSLLYQVNPIELLEEDRELSSSHRFRGLWQSCGNDFRGRIKNFKKYLWKLAV